MVEKYPMTPEGKKRLEKELSYLKNIKQKEINDEIKHLRGFCDFSEDMTFKEKLNQQSLLSKKIMSLENKLLNAEIVSMKDKDISTVGLYTIVTFLNLKSKEKETYEIVGDTDADPLNNKISSSSPIGKSLLGKKVNDEISVKTPGELLKIKILNIS